MHRVALALFCWAHVANSEASYEERQRWHAQFSSHLLEGGPCSEGKHCLRTADQGAHAQSLARTTNFQRQEGKLSAPKKLAALLVALNPASAAYQAFMRARHDSGSNANVAPSARPAVFAARDRFGHHTPVMSDDLPRDSKGLLANRRDSSPERAAPRLDRRAALRLGAALSLAFGAATGANALPALSGYDPAAAVTRPQAGRNFFVPLTPPITDRATYRYELGRDAWALEQLLVFANVSATVRTVVVKMSDGKLWINGPQWPTGEFCSLLDELGPVGHVVLPVTALEHKAPMASFIKKYPSASVWIAPGQYGPFGKCSLDVASAKMGYRVDGILPVGAPTTSSPMPPWASEFDMRTLYVDLPQNAGPVAEAAFFHKPTKTLITTDSVIFVPPEGPKILGTYFSKSDTASPDFWPKSVLQSVFLKLRKVGNQWPGYEAVQGRLLRAPILRAFADARAPDATRDWVRSVAKMGQFDRILTSHFASPIVATPADYEAAFNYLEGPTSEPPIACTDWSLLDDLNSFIDTNKLGAPVLYDFKQGCGNR